MAASEVAIMTFPTLASAVGMAYMAPMGVFELTLGFWLLIKGVRTEQTR